MSDTADKPAKTRAAREAKATPPADASEQPAPARQTEPSVPLGAGVSPELLRRVATD